MNNYTMLQEMQPNDWPLVSKIYEDGIKTGFATFETKVPTYAHWDDMHLEECRFVAKKSGAILGWAALSPVSSRCVYGGVAEVSVYVSENSRGLGVGRFLMEELIKKSEDKGIWTLQSGIFPDNITSIKLHEKVGFRYIGKKERVGQLRGVWKDNLLFEKRSDKVGL
ncbi:MAG: N-acetyltransferase [Flavobacteriaceae bacterium]|nr:MAG: N-acetyltransferase [Flavobacteriaceae bacterium]